MQYRTVFTRCVRKASSIICRWLYGEPALMGSFTKRPPKSAPSREGTKFSVMEEPMTTLS